MQVGVVPCKSQISAPVSPYSLASVVHMSTPARLHGAGGGQWTSLIVLAVVVMLPKLAGAEQRRPGIAACAMPTFATAVAGAAIDGRTFVLDDGREVRLAGLELPAGATDPDAPGTPHAARARQHLHALVAGRPVMLGGPGGERDRYGRLAAHVRVLSEETERWVQAELVAAGDARVSARVGDRSCATELHRHERAAREARLGLWSDPYYLMRRAEDAAAISRERGRFTIVEGQVLSVRESGGTIYVNFGRRWSEDFTVTIAKRNERTFATAGLDPKRLAGRRVRVRGWIEERGGPWVEATRPEQIELVERN
jgi:endonuclease YncB( thermonuclease family)